MLQLWHTPVPERLKWSAYDRGGKLLQPQRRAGKHAALYGVLEASTEIVFTTDCDKITTEISVI